MPRNCRSILRNMPPGKQREGDRVSSHGVASESSPRRQPWASTQKYKSREAATEPWPTHLTIKLAGSEANGLERQKRSQGMKIVNSENRLLLGDFQKAITIK